MGDCTAALTALNASFVALQQLYTVATAPPPDPCASPPPAQYSVALHVGCIFVILCVSVLGTVIPILGSHRSKFAAPPFLLVLGKCCATGVILACALIHMLQPSSASLTSACLPDEFSVGYPAYAFLFAMCAALAMQLLEDVVERAILARLPALGALPPRSESGDGEELGLGGHGHSHGHSHGGGSGGGGHGHSHEGGSGRVHSREGSNSDHARSGESAGGGAFLLGSPIVSAATEAVVREEQPPVATGGNDGATAAAGVAAAPSEQSGVQQQSCSEALSAAAASSKAESVDVLVIVEGQSTLPGCNVSGAEMAPANAPQPLSVPVRKRRGSHDLLDATETPRDGGGVVSEADRVLVALRHVHVHAGGTPHESKKGGGNARFIIAAVLMELGVSVHSIFIGLAVGVLPDPDLTALFIALCFHQFFEGVALGSRLVDAAFSSLWLEAGMAAVFAVSAPVGLGIGVALVGSGGLNTAGPTFLLVQGTFDGVCAGILLYLGVALLQNDFPEDLHSHSGPASSARGRGLRRSAMYLSLWAGAGAMAAIGRYL